MQSIVVMKHIGPLFPMTLQHTTALQKRRNTEAAQRAQSLHYSAAKAKALTHGFIYKASQEIYDDHNIDDANGRVMAQQPSIISLLQQEEGLQFENTV